MGADYHHDDINTMHIPEKDWRYFAQHNGVYRFEPVAKRILLQVAESKDHIQLMKTFPQFREMLEEDRANWAAGRPLSLMMTDDRKKLARASRERRS
jgi:hypothetical protein